jgi:serine/threonine protein kinase
MPILNFPPSYIDRINTIYQGKQSDSYGAATEVLSDIITTIFSISVPKDFTDQQSQKIKFFSATELEGIELGKFLGSGTFGSVFSGFHEGRQIALKLNKSKDSDEDQKEFLDEIQNEAQIIQKLNEQDPKDRHSIVRMCGSGLLDSKTFCLVMHLYAMDLHDFLYKENKYGLPLDSICKIAKELFSTLVYLRDSKIVHCDLKPRNILIQKTQTPMGTKLQLRIADFGSAVTSPQSNEEREYKVTRYYRAPEIALGRGYDYSIDLWAIGCVLFELHTKSVLFRAESNLELLKMFTKLLGPVSKDLINLDIWKKHFVPCEDKDMFTLPLKARESVYMNIDEQFSHKLSPKANIWSIHKDKGRFHTEEIYGAFKNLLSKIFRWDKRPSIEELLQHSFFMLINQNEDKSLAQ